MEQMPHLRRHPYLTLGHGYIDRITKLSLFSREAKKIQIFMPDLLIFKSVLIIAETSSMSCLHTNPLEVIFLQPFHCKSQSGSL